MERMGGAYFGGGGQNGHPFCLWGLGLLQQALVVLETRLSKAYDELGEAHKDRERDFSIVIHFALQETVFGQIFVTEVIFQL